MVKIAPSILSADFAHLASDIKEAEKGGADMIHIDVMDGNFVSNITIGPVVIAGIRKVTKLPFDVHLMISNPQKYIDDFVYAGSDILTVHAEASSHLHGVLQNIKKHHIKAGCALNPSTPISVIENVLGEIDMVVVMTVNPGFGGQGFIESIVPKIRNMKEAIEKGGYNIELQVDGGISHKNAKLVVDAGADILVAGSAVFKGEKSIKENIAAIKNAV
jgi:ribulose-phosphate 3-epimerase